MKLIKINGRDCWVNAPASPTRCVVCLHAATMTALEMYGCALGNQPDTDVLFVFPSSERLTHWDYSSTETADFAYLSELDSELCVQHPTLQSVALAGFSNGGFMAALLAAQSYYAFDSFFLVCATMSAGIEVSPDQLPCQLTIMLGNSDDLVPAAGGHGFMSELATQQAFEAVGFTVNIQPFDGGHCWPGGVCDFPDPNWCMNVSATQTIINAVKGLQ